ncbi:MAG: hypothetical protein R3B99_35825 [Polyangiales bacterium]
MQTLEDLFPGATGKLQVARIILRYGMPESRGSGVTSPRPRARPRLMVCKQEMAKEAR